MTTYRSKRDAVTTIIYFLIIFAGFFMGNYSVFQLIQGVEESTIYYFNVFVGYGVSFLFLVTYLSTFYVLKDNKKELYVRCGPFVDHIPYRDIKTMEPIKSYQIGMSLSRDRIKLSYGERRKTNKPIIVHISPDNQEAFMKAMHKRCDRLNEVEILK